MPVITYTNADITDLIEGFTSGPMVHGGGVYVFAEPNVSLYGFGHIVFDFGPQTTVGPSAPPDWLPWGLQVVNTVYRQDCTLDFSAIPADAFIYRVTRRVTLTANIYGSVTPPSEAGSGVTGVQNLTMQAGFLGGYQPPDFFITPHEVTGQYEVYSYGALNFDQTYNTDRLVTFQPVGVWWSPGDPVSRSLLVSTCGAPYLRVAWSGISAIHSSAGATLSYVISSNDWELEVVYELVAISPREGTRLGGTVVTVAISESAAYTTEDMTVTFDGVEATDIVILDDFHLTCVTPSRATVGVVDVVITPFGEPPITLVDGYTYVTRLTLTPIIGYEDMLVTFTIDEDPAVTLALGVNITFDEISAIDIVVVSESVVTCRVPAHDPGLVEVIFTPTDTDGTSFSRTFTYLELELIPITGSIAGDTFVTLTVAENPDVTLSMGVAVTFDGIPATDVIVVSETQVTCRTPAHAAGVVDVVLTPSDADGSFKTSVEGYTYITVKEITEIVPSSGSKTGGTVVTLTGSGFIDGVTVDFDGTPLTSVVVVDETTITAVTPAHAVGVVDVRVTWPDEPDETIDTLVDGFSYGIAITAPHIDTGPVLTVTGPAPKQVMTDVTVTPGTNNGVLSYSWTQVSGPASVVPLAPSSANTPLLFNTYEPGTYIFQLTVTTGDEPQIATTAQITAILAETQPPRVH